MRCPVCGAKMIQGGICKYCMVTNEQVENCSNKKVSHYRKNDMADLICFTTFVPKDVSRMKLILFTIFFGFFGVNHFYVKRNVRGTYSILSVIVSFVFLILQISIPSLSGVKIFKLMYELAFAIVGVNVLLWVFDIVNVCLGNFKIPVVLADKEDNR